MKKLFVLGDSISNHYGPYLESFTDGCFAYDRKGKGVVAADLNYVSLTNGGDSGNCVDYLTQYEGLTCDYLLLNCGLHDIKTKDGARQVTEENYAQNLRKIIAVMAGRAGEIVWMSTTPVDDDTHNSREKVFLRYNRDVLRYNAIAEGVMKESRIPIIDLYTFTSRLGGAEIFIDHVHFTEDIRKLQAAFIAGQLIGKELLIC